MPAHENLVMYSEMSLRWEVKKPQISYQNKQNWNEEM